MFSIGVALPNGKINVDKKVTCGKATLFEGNTVETDGASSRLQLTNGVRVILAANSGGIVYRNQFIFRKGAAQVDAPGKYAVSARFLRIEGTHVLIGTSSLSYAVAVDIAISRAIRIARLSGWGFESAKFLSKRWFSTWIFLLLVKLGSASTAGRATYHFAKSTLYLMGLMDRGRC